MSDKTSRMTLRPYTPSDAAQLGAFEYWTNALSHCGTALTAPNTIFLLCLNGTEPIGIICGENTALYGNILYAAEVLKPYWNRGVMRKMFSAYLNRATGSVTVFHNAELDGLYRSLGFEVGENTHVSLYVK